MKQIIISSIFAAAIAVAVTLSVVDGNSSTQKSEQSVYDRVIQNGELRCGYAIWPPYLYHDKEGNLTGIWYDYLEEVGKLLSVKINWVVETGYGMVGDDLVNNKFDAFCAGFWRDVRRSRKIDYVTPISYATLGVYVRPDDKRFDDNLEAINDPEVTVATLDGEMSSVIQQSDFPKAKVLSLPQLSDGTTNLMNVASGKADVTFTNTDLARRYMEANPNSLRKVYTAEPIRIFPETIAVKKGAHDLRKVLDYATKELLNTGKINKILAKHEMDQKALFRVQKPYIAVY